MSMLLVAALGAGIACAPPHIGQADRATGLTAGTLLERRDQADTTRAAVADTAMEQLWARGRSVREFAVAARALREQWRREMENASIPAALVARARNRVVRWRILAVAADGCHDSMHGLPILGALDDSLANLDVRVITPDIGAAIQHENRSYNGRRVTPTIILLDSTGAQMGCIIERPRALRERVRTAFGDFVGSDSANFSSRALMEAFWATDRGVAMATEAIELLEGAERGFPICSRGQPAPGGRDPIPRPPVRRSATPETRLPPAPPRGR